MKGYAYLGSITKVAETMNELGFLLNGSAIEPTDVSKILKSKGKNDLHKILKSGYLKKTRASRRKTKSYF